MKIAFSVTCNNGYVFYLDALIKSVIYNNPDFDYDYLIWTDGSIPEETKNYFKSIYDKIKFIDINLDKYIAHGKKIKCFSFECFYPRGYDKIIYNGADMLCINSIKPIIDFKIEDSLGLQIENRRRETYNNGCMIVPRYMMTVDNYNGLMNSDYSHNTRVSGTDQKAIQLFFNRQIIKTPPEFNVLISELEWSVWKNIIFLHYYIKPNAIDFVSRSSQKLLDIWNFYKNMPIEQVKAGKPKIKEEITEEIKQEEKQEVKNDGQEIK